MLANKDRIMVCNFLIEQFLPPDFAAANGFSTDTNEWIFLAGTAQQPRPESQTVIYFSATDQSYKGMSRSDPKSYDNNNNEILDQMRQIELTIDCYSKVTPIGTANDVIRMLNAGFISEQYEDVMRNNDWGFALEQIELSPPLSPLLQGQVWNERSQMIARLNYRDSVQLAQVFMTRKPISIWDLPNSVALQTVVKS